MLAPGRWGREVLARVTMQGLSYLSVGANVGPVQHTHKAEGKELSRGPSSSERRKGQLVVPGGGLARPQRRCLNVKCQN